MPYRRILAYRRLPWNGVPLSILLYSIGRHGRLGRPVTKTTKGRIIALQGTCHYVSGMRPRDSKKLYRRPLVGSSNLLGSV